jgi:hypothetical protein
MSPDAGRGFTQRAVQTEADQPQAATGATTPGTEAAQTRQAAFEAAGGRPRWEHPMTKSPLTGQEYANPIEGYRVPLRSETCTRNSGTCPLHSTCDGGCPPVGQAPAVGVIRL